MHHRLRELHAACLPFVTRALRGSTRRRVTLGAALLVLAVLLLGTFIGHSASFAARDLRVSLGLEDSRWEREQREFTIFVDDQREYDEARRQAQRPATSTQSWPLRHRAQQAWVLLDMVGRPEVWSPRPYRELQAQAWALRNAKPELAPPDEARRSTQNFDWYSEADRRQLQTVIDAELQPHVVIYRSPLDAAATIRIIGALAGVVLLMLLTVIGPLWVGVQLAQELHENTLQPLTGTALTARQLVLGLVAGPLSPVAIVGAPMLGLVLVAAATTGRIVPALGLVTMTSAMGAMLVGLCMLTALAVGRQRAPGLVGIGLLGLLGTGAMGATAVGLELPRQMLGFVTILPGAGPAHLWSEAFFPQAHLSAAQAQALDLRLVLATIGAVVLAALALRALERRVGGTHRDGALRPLEAGVGALVLAALAVAAIPSQASFGETYLAATGLVLVPLQLLLMGRVPGGDAPARLRHVPVARLLSEHAIWLGMVLVAVLVVADLPHRGNPGAIVGVMHLLWAVVVTALVTLRGSALPTTILVKLWLMVCLGFAMVEFTTGAVWCVESPHVEMLFPLAAAHPLLGVLHVGMFLWIPVSLMRGLVPKRPALDLHARDDA